MTPEELGGAKATATWPGHTKPEWRDEVFDLAEAMLLLEEMKGASVGMSRHPTNQGSWRSYRGDGGPIYYRTTPAEAIRAAYEGWRDD